jgi:hypothetical protein
MRSDTGLFVLLFQDFSEACRVTGRPFIETVWKSLADAALAETLATHFELS